MQKTILITRPRNLALTLLDKLKNLSFNAICLELIAIQPKKFSRADFSKLLNYYLLIFISRNAVEYSFGAIKGSEQGEKILKDFLHIFQTQKNTPLVATIGESSANELYQYGIKDVIYPKNNIYNSESLWQEIKHLPFTNKKVAIIKGDSGRDFLSTKLKEKQVVLEEISVYKRTTPKNLKIDFKNIFEQQQIDIILITCKSSLDNLVELAAHNTKLGAKIQIFNITLLVVSQRLYEKTKQLGFQNLITALNATDTSIINILKTLEL